MLDFGEHVPQKKHLDLTPMLDVVFLLLIFFLLTSFVAHPSLPLALPQAETGRSVPPAKIGISIEDTGVIRLDGHEVAKRDLAAALASVPGVAAGDLSLAADRNVPFGTVVEVMDIAKKVGVQSISVVTDRKN